ncbi:MAG TPA: hypothetical protein VLJ60_06440 [bacterium]|nr:hypothetical protein [bacterium]
MEKKYFVIIAFMAFFYSCSENKIGDDYGLCKEGSTRCTGNKLEICTSFKEWALKTECDFYGGECVTDGKNSYCTNMEDDKEWFDGYFDWGEEEDDDYIEEDDDNIIYDQDVYDEDVFDGEEYFDDDDYEQEDIDIIDEDVVEPVCGNGELETGEVCEKGDLTDCTEIDPEKYSGGKAFCLDDCLGYNTITCSEK